MYQHILVATDGSEAASHAVRQAVALAQAARATVHAVFVLDTRAFPGAHPILAQSLAPQYFEMLEELRKAGRAALDAAERAGAEGGVAVTTETLEGVPAASIVETAKAKGVDLVVLGSRGHFRMESLLLGSTAQGVVHASTVPVLLVR